MAEEGVQGAGVAEGPVVEDVPECWRGGLVLIEPGGDERQEKESGEEGGDLTGKN